VRLCAEDVRAAIPLSGGLDSRLLLGLLAPESEGRIVAACYGAPGSQDVELSRNAARAVGVEHRFVPFRASEVLSSERRNVLARRIGLTTRLTLADGGMALAQAYGARAAQGTRDVGYFLPGHSGMESAARS
jgi:asparagine synthase (glutamine-hydrolysing)